jgi:hypothetical protein
MRRVSNENDMLREHPDDFDNDAQGQPADHGRDASPIACTGWDLVQYDWSFRERERRQGASGFTMRVTRMFTRVCGLMRVVLARTGDLACRGPRRARGRRTLELPTDADAVAAERGTR